MSSRSIIHLRVTFWIKNPKRQQPLFQKILHASVWILQHPKSIVLQSKVVRNSRLKVLTSPTILHDFPYSTLHNLFLPCLAEMMWVAAEAWNAFKNTKHSSSQALINQHYFPKHKSKWTKLFFKFLTILDKFDNDSKLVLVSHVQAWGRKTL